MGWGVGGLSRGREAALGPCAHVCTRAWWPWVSSGWRKPHWVSVRVHMVAGVEVGSGGLGWGEGRAGGGKPTTGPCAHVCTCAWWPWALGCHAKPHWVGVFMRMVDLGAPKNTVSPPQAE